MSHTGQGYPFRLTERSNQMSEVVVDPTVRVHFGYERKNNLGNYNHAVASANVSVDIPAESDQAEVVAKIQAIAAAVKVAVLAELGIEATFDENGVVQEATAAPAVTLSVSEAAAKLEGAFAGPSDGGADTGEARRQDDSFDWGKVPADVVAAFNADPSAFYDNRASKTPGSKGPDLKRKSDGKGFWVVSKF